MQNSYKSFWSQDLILNTHFFKNSKDGIFVDIGAHDGISGSNSYFFEKELNWKGICVEPDPVVFESLKKNRNCHLVNKGVYNKETIVEFLKCSGEIQMLSGIIDSYEKEHLNRIDKESKELKISNNKKIFVQTVRFDDLVKSYNFNIIDYLSIDTEGSEYEIIESIDFKRTHINVIDYEDNYPQSEKSNKIYKLLEENDFIFWKRVSGDNIFINKTFIWNWMKNKPYDSSTMLYGWTFYKGLDIMGCDLCSKQDNNLGIYIDKALELNSPSFNTMGFMKNSTQSLQISPYFGDKDGIYIRNF